MKILAMTLAVLAMLSVAGCATLDPNAPTPQANRGSDGGNDPGRNLPNCKTDFNGGDCWL